MLVEILKCKDCGTIMVIERKMLWSTKSCCTCESTNIELFEAEEDEVIG